MGWFSRRRPRGDSGGPTSPISGEHRSPGLSAVAEVLKRLGHGTVLDLGASSTENLEFFSRLGLQVQVLDLYRSCGGTHEVRAEPFRFSDVDALPLPDDEGPFDAVLVWDLFHYVLPKHHHELARRLSALSRTGTQILVLASVHVPIPHSPLVIKVAADDRVSYQVDGDVRMPEWPLTPREVGKVLTDWRPERVFQLRNGLQELVYRYEGPRSEPPLPS